MGAQKAFSQPVKSPLMIMCSILITLGHLSCNLTALEQNKATPVRFNENQVILTTLDISDAQNPQILSSINLPSISNKSNNVIVSRRYGYATTSRGLHIIDLSVLQKPRLIASVELSGEINRVRLFKDHIYIGSNQGLHIVDVSKPHQPVVVRTGGPEAYENMRIRDFELHRSYAYVMDTNNYLHVLDLSASTNPRLIQSVTISPHWLLGVRADGPIVELIQLPNSPSFSPEIWEELLNRENLLEFGGWYDKIRVSDDHLVFVDSRGWEKIAFARRSPSPMKGEFQYFYPGSSYLAHLYLTRKRKIDNQTPTDTYVQPRSVVLMAQDKWSQTVRVPGNLLGQITDIQLSENMLCMTSSNGVFLIADVTETKNHKVLSAIDLLSYQPISIAIGEGYACVMGIPSG